MSRNRVGDLVTGDAEQRGSPARRVDGSTAGIRVRDRMSSPVLTVRPDSTTDEIEQLLARGTLLTVLSPAAAPAKERELGYLAAEWLEPEP